ncbi:hypothetical protein HanIR_Chr06g0264301 [Helianthus annuus]|nr:hypothetical protein HanIR_Chr06g0264301 [Helianthus annuus]
MFTNINERTRPLFMFDRLTKRTKFLVRVRLFNKRTNTNELSAERFTNCSPTFGSFAALGSTVDTFALV